jgi:hypothetical protein
MSDILVKSLFVIYVIGALITYGHASHNTKSGVGVAPIASMAWPLYVSYKIFEPKSKEEIE